VEKSLRKRQKLMELKCISPIEEVGDE